MNGREVKFFCRLTAICTELIRIQRLNLVIRITNVSRRRRGLCTSRPTQIISLFINHILIRFIFGSLEVQVHTHKNSRERHSRTKNEAKCATWCVDTAIRHLFTEFVLHLIQTNSRCGPPEMTRKTFDLLY